jgi:hypothetical protein
MFVHSCCCIGIFVLSGLIQIQKRIQNKLKMLWNIWKGKRKRVSLLSLAFGLWSPAAHHRPRPACSRVRGRLPRFPAWAEPSKPRRWPSSLHAHAAAVSFSHGVSLTPWPHTSGPSSPRRADFLPRSTDRIRLQISFFPYLEHPRAIYSELAHPSAPSYLEATDRRRPEEATLEPQSEPSAIPSSTPSPGRLRLRFLPWWARHVLYFIPVFFFRKVTLWIAR